MLSYHKKLPLSSVLYIVLFSLFLLFQLVPLKVLLTFVNKWKINPLYEKNVLRSDTGYETFTPKEVGNIKNENIYSSIRETREPTQQTPKKERESEKEVTCKECQYFMSMDKNKWCGEDNQNNKNKKKRKPTPPELEKCDNCKELMKEDTDCKKLNKNEESHYQNAVGARPTINTKETHKEQTYARLQSKTQRNFNNPKNPTYAKLNRAKITQNQPKTVYNNLKIIAESKV